MSCKQTRSQIHTMAQGGQAPNSRRSLPFLHELELWVEAEPAVGLQESSNLWEEQFVDKVR